MRNTKIYIWIGFLVLYGEISAQTTKESLQEIDPSLPASTTDPANVEKAKPVESTETTKMNKKHSKGAPPSRRTFKKDSWLFYAFPFLRIFSAKDPEYIQILSLEGRIGGVFIQESIASLQPKLKKHYQFDLKTKPWSSIHGGGSLKWSSHEFINMGIGFDYLRFPRFSETDLLFYEENPKDMGAGKRGLVWHDFLLFFEIETSTQGIEVKEEDALIRKKFEKTRIKQARKARMKEDPSYKEKIKELEDEENKEEAKNKKSESLNQFNLSWILRSGINIHWQELQIFTGKAGTFDHRSEFSGPGIMLEPGIRFYFRLKEQSYVFVEYAHTMLFDIKKQIATDGFRHAHKLSFGVNFMNPTRFKRIKASTKLESEEILSSREKE